ncbi:transcriptional regulator [Bergeriella denitrificans]|uniref:transcriptional regulator n=1 Tax=Bergeriella denitrificans TaxID=494 RepID=UPI0009ED6077|nr:Cro/CI family transcriptional regulator [Bergeriella denitrificans]
MNNEAFQKMLDNCGSISSIAKHFGIRPWAVSKWKKQIPAERCQELVKLSKGKLKPSELRPDIFD